MTRLKTMIAAIGLVLATAFGATAQDVTASSPDSLLEVLRGFGPAELGKDKQGDPRIQGRIESIRYYVFFHGCENGQNCTYVIFSSGFSGARASQQVINQWNREGVMTRAFLDNRNNPFLQMAVNLRHGVSRANFDDTVDWWRLLATTFRDRIYGS